MSGKRIVDASPLIFLTRAGLLEILRVGEHDVVVPSAVIEEIGRHGPDDPTVEAMRLAPWISVATSSVISPDVAAWGLGPGESAVLSLAWAEPGAVAVIDDGMARRVARGLPIPFIGTLGLVIFAKQEKRIGAARPVVERLRESGMYLADRMIDEALAQVGE